MTLKLVLAFGALMAILLGVGWLGLDRMARMNSEIQEVVDQRWHKIQLSREALRYSALNSRITMQVFLIEDPAEIDALLELRASNTEKISSLLGQIEAEAASESEKTAIDAIWKARRPYIESYQRALALLRLNQPEAGRAMMVQVALPGLIAYHKSWETFVEMQGRQMELMGDLAETHYRSARGQVFGLLVLAALLAGGIAIFVTRHLTREMARRLVAEWEVREAHAELEQRVERRTAELRNANHQLHATAVERAAALQGLQVSEQRFRTLSASAPVGIFETDADGRALYTNHRWQEITGLRPAESLGAGWRDAVHAEDTANFFCQWNRTAKEGEGFEGEVRFRRPDGEVRWVHVRSVPVHAESGEVIGHVGTAEDISQRKRADEELAKLHRELLDTSRKAGMAEVATSVLHNVGNVLNSVNVASHCVADGLRKSRVSSLGRVVAMLHENADDLGAFFTMDPRGRKVPGFLAQLAGHLAGEQNAMLGELGQLQKNIDHIKEIVTMQQSFAKTSGVAETLRISELVEEALRLNGASHSNHLEQIECEFDEAVPPVTVERHKVLQILVNLVRNAKHACEDSGRGDRQVKLRVLKGDGYVKIAVSDNGIGIPPENLTRIFNHGFTTRKEGHGFGLHSGALAARELGGALHVESDGAGRGATFTLELPL